MKHTLTFFCSCIYTGVDLCTAGAHQCNSSVSACRPTANSYFCQCNEGYIAVKEIHCVLGMVLLQIPLGLKTEGVV